MVSRYVHQPDFERLYWSVMAYYTARHRSADQFRSTGPVDQTAQQTASSLIYCALGSRRKGRKLVICLRNIPEAVLGIPGLFSDLAAIPQSSCFLRGALMLQKPSSVHYMHNRLCLWRL